MNIKTMLACVALFLSSPLLAQDYIKYQEHFNDVDIYVKKKDLHSASALLDTIDKEYRFVFAKHCMMALQVCCAGNDSVYAERWLARCFLSGIPAWIIRQNAITEKTLHYATTHAVWLAYDSLRGVYKNSIDTLLATRITNLMDKDMYYTNKVNNGPAILSPVRGLQWIRHNALIHKELKQIILEYGFPGERLIGLDPQLEDSVAYSKIIREDGLVNVLCQKKALFMLLHYFSTPRNHINPLLFHSIGNGLLPVEYYARVSDYQHIGSRHRKHDSCFYVHSLIRKEDTHIVNARRARIGLFSYQHQQENNELYWERKRNGTLNVEIIYE